MQDSKWVTLGYFSLHIISRSFDPNQLGRMLVFQYVPLFSMFFYLLKQSKSIPLEEERSVLYFIIYRSELVPSREDGCAILPCYNPNSPQTKKEKKVGFPFSLQVQAYSIRGGHYFQYGQIIFNSIDSTLNKGA